MRTFTLSSLVCRHYTQTAMSPLLALTNADIVTVATGYILKGHNETLVQESLNLLLSNRRDKKKR